MKKTFTAKHVSLTASMRAYLDRKLGGIEKIAPVPLIVRVTIEKNAHHRHGKIMTLRFSVQMGRAFLTVEERAEDFLTVVDLAVARLRRRIERTKEQRRTLRRRQ